MVHQDKTKPMKLYSTDIVVIDLEASCPDESSNEVGKSNIIEIAAVKLDKSTLEIKNSFNELVKPKDYPILPYIEEMTGITPEMVESCDYFDKVAARFVEWYGNRNRSILAAFGTYYDIPLLRKEFRRFGLNFKDYFVGGALDIRSLGLTWLALHGHNTTGISPEKILLKMGSDTSDYSFHRALDDAKAAASILKLFHFNS